MPRIGNSVGTVGTKITQLIGGVTGFGGGFDDSNDSKAPTVQNINGRIITKLYIDLAGNDSTTDDLDIIGDGATASAYIYRHSNSVNGHLAEVQMTCIEEPTTGVADIDLYMKVDDAPSGEIITTQVEGEDMHQAVITAGEAWEPGMSKQATFGLGDFDTAYLYLTCGDDGSAGAYGAGKFIITITANETF